MRNKSGSKKHKSRDKKRHVAEREKSSSVSKQRVSRKRKGSTPESDNQPRHSRNNSRRSSRDERSRSSSPNSCVKIKKSRKTNNRNSHPSSSRASYKSDSKRSECNEHQYRALLSKSRSSSREWNRVDQQEKYKQSGKKTHLESTVDLTQKDVDIFNNLEIITPNIEPEHTYAYSPTNFMQEAKNIAKVDEEKKN